MASHAHSTPTSTPSPSRRTLFRGAAAVIIGSGITAGAAASVADYAEGGASADANLIAICAKAEAAEDHSWAVWDAAAHLPPRDPRVTAAYDESHRIYDVCRGGMQQVTEMHPSTVAGMRAKASLALREINNEDEEALPLVRSVLMQLAGWTV